MLSEEKNIDDLFRNKNEEHQPDMPDKAADWEQMNGRLNAGLQDPPKKRYWKKITRRAITYMGVTAIVVTTTYYAYTSLSHKNNKAIVAAAPPATVVKKINAVPLATNASTTAKTRPVTSSSSKIPQKKTIKPTVVKSGVNVIRQQSDTIFAVAPVIKTAETMQENAIKIDHFFTQIKQPTQQFLVNPSRDTILFGAKGTAIKIPAYVFGSSQQIIRTPVTIQLAECYTYDDMLAYNLTTTSRGVPLVSGGMVYLSASNETIPSLRISPYRSIGISMPAENFDPEMQLFVNKNIQESIIRDSTSDYLPATSWSDGRSVQWQPSGQLQGYQNNSRFVFPDKIKLFDVQQYVEKNTIVKEPLFFVKTNKNISDEKIKYLISNKINVNPGRIKIQRVNTLNAGPVAKNTTLLITDKGFVAIDSISIPFATAIKSGYVNSADSFAFVNQVRADSLRYVEARRRDSIAYIKKQLFNKAYQFEITGMGWINCDKFYKSTQPLIEFSVKPTEDFQYTHCRYNLVFTNNKSVMTGFYRDGEIHFGKLPKGEPVQLVCVTANEEKAMACIKAFTIESNQIANLKFTEITPAQFREQVSKLTPTLQP